MPTLFLKSDAGPGSRDAAQRAKKTFFKKSEGETLHTLLLKASKKGEGSRGGHIIGHYRNGDPIYGSKHESYAAVRKLGQDDHGMAHGQAVLKTHPGLSALDHQDAADHHFRQGIATNKGKTRDNHMLVSHAHSEAKRIMNGSLKQLGKTESGKPVFSDTHGSHPSAHSFTAADHEDAAHLHNVHASEIAQERSKHPEGSEAHRAANDKLRDVLHRYYSHINAAKALEGGIKKSEAGAPMQTLLLKAAKTGEGSRGGYIIGHTKNGGHPIYASTAATSRKYSDLGANDHVHARDMHKELAEHFAAKAKQSGISDEEKQHARASASNHRKQSQGHARKYAEMFGHYRNALTNGAMAAGASHKAPSNKAKEKAYLEGQDKVSAARAVYDGKPFKKSLDALYPSDGLHQMGAQYDQGNPIDWDAERASFAEQIAEKNKTKKSEGNDMQTFLIKAATKGEGSRGGKIIGHSRGGSPIYASSHAGYKAALKDPENAAHHVAVAHPSFDGADHLDAAHAHMFNRKYPTPGGDDAKVGAHNKAAKTLEDAHRQAAYSKGVIHKFAHGNGYVMDPMHGPYETLDSKHSHAKNGARLHEDLKPYSARMHEEAASAHKDRAGATEGIKKQMHETAAGAHAWAAKHIRSMEKSRLSGGSLQKSLEALAPSDGLHQMAAQFAKKHPDMSASDHMAASQKYAKAGQPHMAIGHMMASSYKSAVAKKSMAANVLKDYLSKAGGLPPIPGTGSKGGKKTPMGRSIGKTYSGHGIPGVKSAAYGHISSETPSTEHEHKAQTAAHAEGMAQHFQHYGVKDHVSAYHTHAGLAPMKSLLMPAEGAKHQKIAEAHLHLAHKLNDAAKLGKSLSKAGGEGRRGGHVIGHTRSGKPIYESGHASYKKVHDLSQPTARQYTAAAQSAHPSYTKQDHKDARDAHSKMHETHYGEHPIIGKTPFHAQAALAHHEAYQNMRKSLSKAGGEGSRGGKIIGHTKSGKPIYSAAHDSYSGIQNLASQGASMGGHGRAARDAHPKYSKQDHADASYAHHLEGQKEGGARGFGLASANASHAHHAAFNQMRSRAAAATRDVKKSQADLIFNDMLKASGITMWAPKDEPAAPLALN